MSLKELFPVYLYSSDFRGPSLSRWLGQLREDTYKLEKIDDAGRKWSRSNYRGGYTSYASVCDLHRRFSAFTELETKLEPHVRKLARALDWDLSGRRLQMTTCWTSRMARNTYHPLHVHPLSVLSGTFYVDVPRGTSRLKIENPTLDLKMASPPRLPRAREKNRDYFHCEPKAGRFFLFESWLRHEVPPNPVAGDRISVSFNYEWA